jgi:hypothetical protein
MKSRQVCRFDAARHCSTYQAPTTSPTPWGTVTYGVQQPATFFFFRSTSCLTLYLTHTHSCRVKMSEHESERRWRCLDEIRNILGVHISDERFTKEALTECPQVRPCSLDQQTPGKCMHQCSSLSESRCYFHPVGGAQLIKKEMMTRWLDDRNSNSAIRSDDIDSWAVGMADSSRAEK